MWTMFRTKSGGCVTADFQLVIDCADPEPLARFWAAALGYVFEPPPAGFADWDECWRDVGVPEDELGLGADLIVDPDHRGLRIWFQVVPERKTVKNRLHLDIHAGGGRAVPLEVRRQRVDAEARRLADLGATIAAALFEEGSITTASRCGTRRVTSSTSIDG
jgi:hypothetical protein